MTAIISRLLRTMKERGQPRFTFISERRSCSPPCEPIQTQSSTTNLYWFVVLYLISGPYHIESGRPVKVIAKISPLITLDVKGNKVCNTYA